MITLSNDIFSPYRGFVQVMPPCGHLQLFTDTTEMKLDERSIKSQKHSSLSSYMV